MPKKKSTRATLSGHRHVFWDAGREEWYVRIKHNGKYHTAGRYFPKDDLTLAVSAASELRQKLGIPDIDQPFARAPKEES